MASRMASKFNLRWPLAEKNKNQKGKRQYRAQPPPAFSIGAEVKSGIASGY